MSEGDNSRVTRFKYGDVVRGGKLVKSDVWVREGKVIDPQTMFYDERRLPDRVINCEGFIVAPGFIDIQINGKSSTKQFLVSISQ